MSNDSDSQTTITDAMVEAAITTYLNEPEKEVLDWPTWRDEILGYEGAMQFCRRFRAALEAAERLKESS